MSVERNYHNHSIVLLWLVWTLSFSQGVTADSGSKLEQFEEDATRPRKPKEPPQQEDDHKSEGHHESEEHDPDNANAATEPDPTLELIEALPLVIAAGGMYSWDRVSPHATIAQTNQDNHSTSSKATPRELGEGVISYLRIDASYDWIESNIDATDWRVEIGYGPFGFEFRKMHYSETDPNSELLITEYHALYRMSAGDHVEIDIGFGQLDISGTMHNSGWSWTLPILIHPSPHFEFEYRPSWANVNGNDIRNQELAIGAGNRFWAVRAGYHWLDSPGERLSGPFAGLSLRF